VFDPADYGILSDALYLFAIVKGLLDGTGQLPVNVTEAIDFLDRFVNFFPGDRPMWGISTTQFFLPTPPHRHFSIYGLSPTPQ
jgi:hypothetical protein